MRGLDICEKFYKEYSERLFSEFEVMQRAATGLAGEGSECLGYDDDLSRDHDFDPGFCIWLLDDDYEKYGFALSRAYSKLPKEFMGLKRAILSPVGGNRRGVISVSEFYTRFLGSPQPPQDYHQWLYTPSYALCEAVSGRVFFDGGGQFSRVREAIAGGYPDDVIKKKTAAHLALMAQAGQYNYGRCAARGDGGAAAMCAYEFVKHAVSLIYLLNNRYEPFYKWAFRGLRELPTLGDLEFTLSELLQTDNGKKSSATKKDIIEDLAVIFSEKLRQLGLSGRNDNDLEKHAFEVTDRIKDVQLRNMHVMEGI